MMKPIRTLFRILFLLQLPLLGFSQERPDFSIIGFINMADGLGRQSVELMQAFQNEFSMEFIPTIPSNLEDVPSSLHPIILKNPCNNNKLIDINGKVVILEDTIWSQGATNIPKFSRINRKEQITLAYSMLESDRIPTIWVDAFNQHLDAVIVPDSFLVSVYQKSGVKIPIFVLPLGINIEPFLTTPLKSKPHSPFVFGNLSSCYDRKNLTSLIQAFDKEFHNNPDVKLVINCRQSSINYKNLIQFLLKSLKPTNIDFNIKKLNNAEYLQLFQTLDCLVNVSKGEGFSIQPREAMALGIPVILTDNSAQTSICKTGLVKPVPAPFKRDAMYSNLGGKVGFYSDTSPELIGKALRDVYENYVDYLEKSWKARLWAANFTYEALKPYYQNLIKPKKLIFGSENKITEEYLMTNSKQLYSKYSTLIN